jgi:hypothetical protein
MLESYPSLDPNLVSLTVVIEELDVGFVAGKLWKILQANTADACHLLGGHAMIPLPFQTPQL